MYDFIIHIFVCIYVYVLQISSWPTDLSCSETVVRSFHTLELKIAVRPVGSEPFLCKGCDFHGPITRNSSRSHWMSLVNTEVHPRSPEIFQVPSSKRAVLLWSSKMQQRPCTKAGQITKSTNLKPETSIWIQYQIAEKNFTKNHRQVC